MIVAAILATLVIVGAVVAGIVVWIRERDFEYGALTVLLVIAVSFVLAIAAGVVVNLWAEALA